MNSWLFIKQKSSTIEINSFSYENSLSKCCLISSILFSITKDASLALNLEERVRGEDVNEIESTIILSSVMLLSLWQVLRQTGEMDSLHILPLFLNSLSVESLILAFLSLFLSIALGDASALRLNSSSIIIDFQYFNGWEFKKGESMKARESIF